MGVASLHPWMENVYTLRRGGARRRRRHLQGHRRAVRPLGMAAGAEQAAQRLPGASWSAVRKAKVREPESSAGMNSAPQTPQRCGWSDLAGRSERVTLDMRRILYEPLALHERVAAWGQFG